MTRYYIQFSTYDGNRWINSTAVTSLTTDPGPWGPCEALRLMNLLKDRKPSMSYRLSEEKLPVEGT